MIYLLYGLENYLITKEIKNIINKYNIDESSINKYDLSESTYKDIIEDAQMISMFDPYKIIICHGDMFIDKSDEDLLLLEQYIHNPNEQTIVVFVSDTLKLDERRKIIKLIKEKGVVKEIKSSNIFSIVKEMFDEYSIKDEDIKLLIDRVGNNLNLIEQESNKLKMYKYDDKIINKEDIIELISINYDLDIFKLVDDIVNKNKERAFIIYREMLKYNEEPIKIIVMLANQFRLMYQVRVLSKDGLKESEIASKLAVHPYRVKLAKEKAYHYSEDTLLFFLKELGDIDYKIKSGLIDKDFALELFIMEV
jgi:DNA polymerase III subunit delta